MTGTTEDTPTSRPSYRALHRPTADGVSEDTDEDGVIGRVLGGLFNRRYH